MKQIKTRELKLISRWHKYWMNCQEQKKKDWIFKQMKI